MHLLQHADMACLHAWGFFHFILRAFLGHSYPFSAQMPVACMMLASVPRCILAQPARHTFGQRHILIAPPDLLDQGRLVSAGSYVQGSEELQRKVEDRYTQMWGPKGDTSQLAGVGSQNGSVSQMQAFDGRLQMNLPDNVPPNAFAPEVVL